MGDINFNPPLINDEPQPVLDSSTAKATDVSGSAGWTNERHSTFITSMEATFLDQLYRLRRHGPEANNKPDYGNEEVIQEDLMRENMGFAGTDARQHDNTWVRRFRPHHNAAVNRRGEASIDDYGSGTDSVKKKVQTYGREANACAGGNFLSKSKEVSDQNFSEEDVDANDDEPCKRRRPTSTSAEPDDQPT